MPLTVIYKCNKCDFILSLGGPWEFYRNFNGQIIPYGHPRPIGDEAKVIGFYNGEFCLTCRSGVQVIEAEFTEPQLDYWGDLEEGRSLKPEYEPPYTPKCPNCGLSNFFDYINNKEPIISPEIPFCPNCPNGKLIYSEAYFS